MLVHEVWPILMLMSVPASRCCPLITTFVPPAIGPFLGDISTNFGSFKRTNENIIIGLP